MDSTVKKGLKIADAEMNDLDPRTLGTLQIDEPDTDEHAARQYLQCPHCTQLGSYELGVMAYEWFICPKSSCSRPFRA